MDLGLRNKRAIVCGASSGLGRACAEALAGEGVNLVICSRTFDSIFSTARSISEIYGVDTVPIAADVSLPESPEKIVNEAVKKFGGVDILVNNAGGPPPGNFSDVDDVSWEKAFNLTLMSAVRMIRAVLPLMTAQRWGRIINLESLSVKQPIPGLILSNALRSAAAGMANTLARETAPMGVLINTIATGNFSTNRMMSLLKHRAHITGITEEEARANLEAAIPMGRLGRPEELAWLVTFLASEKASYITGAIIQVDGGAYGGLV